MTPTLVQLVIDRRGDGRCVYDEAIELSELGRLRIRRASVVEPDAHGWWWADLSPAGGPRRLGPFTRRSAALAAEALWLAEHWLDGPREAAHRGGGTARGAP